MKEFYMKYFNCKCVDKYVNTKNVLNLIFLSLKIIALDYRLCKEMILMICIKIENIIDLLVLAYPLEAKIELID